MQSSLIGLEACSGAHFLGRALRKQGHDVRLIAQIFQASTAGNCPYYQKGFGRRRHRRGQRGIGKLIGQVLLAGEEAQEWPALLRDLIADRPAKHGIPGFESVEHRALRGLSFDFEIHLALDTRQRP
jgi:hypothetical protein